MKLLETVLELSEIALRQQRIIARQADTIAQLGAVTSEEREITELEELLRDTVGEDGGDSNGGASEYADIP